MIYVNLLSFSIWLYLSTPVVIGVHVIGLSAIHRAGCLAAEVAGLLTASGPRWWAWWAGSRRLLFSVFCCGVVPHACTSFTPVPDAAIHGASTFGGPALPEVLKIFFFGVGTVRLTPLVGLKTVCAAKRLRFLAE